MSLTKIGKFGTAIFFNKLCPFLSLFSFCYSLRAYAGPFDGVPEVLQALFIFLPSFFFLFLKLNNYNCPILRFLNFFFNSACAHLLLNLSSQFLFQLFHFSFPTRISFCFLFMFSVPLFISPSHSYIIFLTFLYLLLFFRH